MKFVIDTNILFSAIIRKSITRKVILSDVFELRFILQKRYWNF